LTSLPAEYITCLDAAEATAMNPLWFLVAVIYVKICISDIDIALVKFVYLEYWFSNATLLIMT
jgi:uncharacterized membrane protein YhdT